MAEVLIKIQTESHDKDVWASQDKTILENLKENKIRIDNSCGGGGTCGTCRIIIIEGVDNLSPPKEIEMELIEFRQFKNYERLSCQNYPTKGLKIKIP